MMLTDEKSLCKRNQKIIVSRDKGNKREHRTINRDGIYKVRQYKLDGDIFNNVKCCDDIKLYSLNEVDDLKNIVQIQKCCVCVTVGNDYEQIREALLERGFKRIYSLEEILTCG